MLAFSWTAPASNGGTPILGYKIAWCQQNATGTFSNFVDLITINNAQTLQYYLTSGLTAGQRYRFIVYSINAIGLSAPSSYIEMIPASTPGSPDTPTLSALTSTRIQISWTFQNTRNGGTPITDYAVYWDNGINGNTAIASASTGLHATFATAAGTVVPGTTYNFWVVAINFVG